MTRRPVDLTKLITDRIRDVPDYPKPGVVFKDITPLLADHTAFAAVVDAIVAYYGRGTIDKVVAAAGRSAIATAVTCERRAISAIIVPPSSPRPMRSGVGGSRRAVRPR